MTFSILVTSKGETGYLHTEVGLDLKARYSVVLDPTSADTFTERHRAERAASKAAARFERVEIEPAP